MANNFYIYAHYTKGTDRIFYVGKGKDKRAWTSSRRNPHWRAIVKKHNGFDVEILMDNLSEKDAFNAERQFIAKIGRSKLCNLTDGGDGVSGHKWSEEQKKQIGLRQIGRVYSEESRRKISVKLTGIKRAPDVVKRHADFLRGRKLDESHKKSISEGLIGRMVSEKTREKISKSNQGQKRSLEARRNMSISHIGKKDSKETKLKKSLARLNMPIDQKNAIYSKLRKKVKCSNGLVFNCLSEACDWINKTIPNASYSHISKAALGKRKSAYGFGWKYI